MWLSSPLSILQRNGDFDCNDRGKLEYGIGTQIQIIGADFWSGMRSLTTDLRFSCTVWELNAHVSALELLIMHEAQPTPTRCL